MRSARRVEWLAAGLATGLTAIALSACGGTGSDVGSSASSASSASPGSSASAVSAVSSASASSATAQASPSSSVEKLTEDVDLSAFTRSTVVDNAWFPLKPGTQLVHKGASTVDGERLAHDVVLTVTDLVKEIEGVRNVVIYELDFTDGTLNEAELAFFAQDDTGTVWHFGQYPEVYENGKLVEAPTWIAGQQGAKVGITMKADPQLGQPSYSQGWGPAVDWKDRARLAKANQKTCVPAGCYTGVLVTEEFVTAEPDAFQLKYYARGVGTVRVGWAGANDQDKEELELVKAVTLDPAALAKVRRQVLALEKHAYQVSKTVYGTTKPMTLNTTAG